MNESFYDVEIIPAIWETINSNTMKKLEISKTAGN